MELLVSAFCMLASIFFTIYLEKSILGWGTRTIKKHI